jgi:hypothetical protein
VSAVEIATDVEQETPARGPRRWRVWFGVDASLVVSAADVAARVAVRAPDSPCDGLHAQRCQAARELATWRVAAGTKLQAGRRAPHLTPSTSAVATLYGLAVGDRKKRGRPPRVVPA